MTSPHPLGWFADVDPEQSPGADYPWQPCLQLEGLCCSIDMWFKTEEQCLDWIRSEIIGKGMLP